MTTKSDVADSPAQLNGMPSGFAGLGLPQALLDGLATLGYEEPTPIQREAIPLLLAGRDLLGMAATGTGKTAAFALPLLARIERPKTQVPPSALILVPTRELAMQVAEAVHKYGRELHVSVLPIYGGQSFGQQLRALKRGVDVIVATPGRALDHLNRQTLQLDQVRVLVLDEADEMLDMGFAEDLEAILSATPPERQTALFSATMPPRIAEIARRHLRDPAELRMPREQLAKAAKARVRQTAYMVPRAHKLVALGRVLDVESPTSALVFCRTRIEVDELTERLNSHGYAASALHGGMDQSQRDRVLEKFRSGKSELLIATDVAARGLDIKHLSHVINYDVPSNPESYVHRIGRTGRAGAEGVAITFAEPRESRMLRNIEQATKSVIQIASLPSVADLQARRMALLQGELEESLRAGDYHAYRQPAQALASEFDALDIAAAALKLVQSARGDGKDDQQEIPTIEPSRGRRPPQHGDAKRPFDRRAERAERTPSPRTHDPKAWPYAQQKPARTKPFKPSANGYPPSTKLEIDLGRKNGVTATSILNVLIDQGGLKPKAVANIAINEKQSLVDVPTDSVKAMMQLIRKVGIAGKKTGVRVHQPDERA